MNAIIVTIGDELLIGQVVDTNSAWIAGELTAAGIGVHEIISISDSPLHIGATLDRWIGHTDVIVLTGGLGPTRDDLTKKALADYFGCQLVLNEAVLQKIENFFKSRGRVMIDTNRDQALVPDQCIVLPNDHGTAPGMWFTRKNTQVVSLPGVPYEMKPLITEQVIPGLIKMFSVPDVLHKTIMTQGVPESYLAEMIKEWESGLPDCMKLAYLPRPGIVRLRLTVTGKCITEGEQMLRQEIDKLLGIIPDHIYGYDNILIEEVLLRLLKERSLFVATAESCTGGNIARMITSIPGSSACFRGSVVAYSNEIKERELGVSAAHLQEYGAVSREVAEEMATGVIKKMNCDVAMAVTGIAGPDGGTIEKPVGTVWITVAGKERIVSRKFLFGGNRERNIEQSSIMAISMLRKMILGLI